MDSSGGILFLFFFIQYNLQMRYESSLNFFIFYFCFISFQNEVSLLRNEVAHLKQLLLAHKDCPVTTLQKKTAYLGTAQKMCGINKCKFKY